MENFLICRTQRSIDLTSRIVSAYVSRNHVQAGALQGLIRSVHAAIGTLGKPSQSVEPLFEKTSPAQIRRSITPDALISFLDGKPYKTLKRHLTRHGLDMTAYRERYGLPVDYPSTAASYSANRSALARGFGLGKRMARIVVKSETTHAKSKSPKQPERARRPSAEKGEAHGPDV